MTWDKIFNDRGIIYRLIKLFLNSGGNEGIWFAKPWMEYVVHLKLIQYCMSMVVEK